MAPEAAMAAASGFAKVVFSTYFSAWGAPRRPRPLAAGADVDILGKLVFSRKYH